MKWLIPTLCRDGGRDRVLCRTVVVTDLLPEQGSVQEGAVVTDLLPGQGTGQGSVQEGPW